VGKRIAIVKIQSASNFIANALQVENIAKIVIVMDAVTIWKMNQLERKQ
jgi:hypothetical protein